MGDFRAYPLVKGSRLYCRTWTTDGGNCCVEVREEWDSKLGVVSVRSGRWYYKEAHAAHRKVERLLDQGIGFRPGSILGRGPVAS